MAPGLECTFRAQSFLYRARRAACSGIYAIAKQPGVALGQMQAISGLGGIGKTQLAIEYAYRQRQYYQAILWARADALDTLNASYSELATLLDLPQKNAEKQEIVVQAVKSWLETQRNWLLILDNLDEPGVLFPSIHNGQPRVLSPFLPDIPGGHLLITTRATDLASLGLGLAHPLPVETLSPQQGASLLLQRANLLTSSNTWETATSHGSKPVTSYDLQCAEELSEELGGLPLALD